MMQICRNYLDWIPERDLLPLPPLSLSPAFFLPLLRANSAEKTWLVGVRLIPGSLSFLFYFIQPCISGCYTKVCSSCVFYVPECLRIAPITFSVSSTMIAPRNVPDDVSSLLSP